MTARPTRRRLLAAAGVLVLLVVAAVVGVRTLGGEDAGPEVTETPGEVLGRAEPGRGRTPLDVSVFTPDDSAPGADAEGRRAAVMLAHGFGSSKDDLADQARRVAEQGYVVLTWSARGFGESGGLIHLSSADWEIRDVSRLVDALAARDDVRLDGEGDPVVGIAGASYGGGAALLGAAYDERIDAAVPAVTWNDLQQSLFPQYGYPTGDRTAQEPPSGVFKQRWAALLYGAALAAGGQGGQGGAPGADTGATTDTGAAGQDPVCGRFAPDVCRLYQRAAAGDGLDASGRSLLARSSYPATGITAPTLLIQGEQDSLFGPDQAAATAQDLQAIGTEVAVRWFEGGHDAGSVAGAIGDGDLLDPALAWFDRHLRDGPDPGYDLDVTLAAPPLSDDGPEERTGSAEEAFNGPPTTDLTLTTGGTQPVLSPPGGQPAALTSLPGAGAALDAAGSIGSGSYQLAALPGATAVFETQPVTEAITVVGSPSALLRVSSTAADATLFASLWLVSEDDSATLPRQLVSPLRVRGGEQEVFVRLPASAYRVEVGQSLRLVVASTDQAYALPGDGRVYSVALADDVLSLPTPATEPVGDGDRLVPPLLLAAVGTLLLLALVGALVALVRSRRRTSAGRAGSSSTGAGTGVDTDVPLVVDGLVKQYSNGFRAVDGVSWRAERGQVVGLLGPNGAGKTTTMRMLVGLIKADEGGVRVLGQRVGPGSPVLAEVGALIEGPGFLPHLTGRENLEAYWAATGRPRAEANVDEVLAVADLGGALDRQVRSYSHGMEQRLGIAQAMLGTPDLLLLDEPTNGLDPPQIRGLRGVLRRYAEGGRTVVVSSHLLGEVEQTCTHVVVMHRGRVVLTGAVDDLTETTGTTVMTLEDGDLVAAARRLAAVPGVESAEPVGNEIRVDGTARRSELVRTLVADGYAVTGVDSRRHLEEVFMGLVGGGEPAQLDPDAPADAEPAR